MKFSKKICPLLGLLAGMLFVQNAVAQQEEKDPANPKEARLEFRVRYVTPEAVYFNGGTSLGVRAGDKIWIMRDGRKILQLEVKYVSEHNASCLLEKEIVQREASPAVRVDDLILWTVPLPEFLKRTRPPADPATNAAPAPAPGKIRTAAPAPKRYVPARRSFNNALNGQISLQAFGQRDHGPQHFDFFESSAYLRLNFARPAGLPLRLSVRARSSQNYRRLGAQNMQKQPALHRVYEIALEYETPATPLQFTVGRMLRNELRGVGYLDGMALGYRLNDRWKTGVFAGAQSELYHYDFRFDEKKLGGFVQLKIPVGKDADLVVAATGVGQYMRRQVSREYLAAEINFTRSAQLYLTQYLEIDYNRKWRKTAGAGAIDLSNAYFNATYYPRGWISFGASYDARHLIRTWETRSIADSLFDRALRQGWRASVNLQPSALVRFTLDGGLQTHRNTPAVYSAGVSANVWNLLRSGAGLSARFSYFGNAVFAGYYPALDLSRNFFSVLYATAGGGAYLYRMGNGAPAQFNPWERLRLDVNLTRKFFLSGTLENFHGDTMRFTRGFIDAGWRF